MDQIGFLEIGAIAGAILTLVSLSGWVIKAVEKHILRAVSPIRNEMGETIKRNRDAAKMSLKYSITRAHEEYMQKGKIGRYALQCIHEMHDQYKELGGNGFVEAIVGQLHNLPIDTSMGNGDMPGLGDAEVAHRE